MSPRVILSLAFVASVTLCPASAPAQTAPPPPATVSVTIVGTIKNFDEFVALVVPETSIQLVPLPADESYSFNTDDKGRFSFKSDLPKLSVPKTATFKFVLPSIPPGRYFLAAQRLRSQGMTAGQRPMFITDKKKPFLLETPSAAKSPVTVNAGELVVWTH